MSFPREPEPSYCFAHLQDPYGSSKSVLNGTKYYESRPSQGVNEKLKTADVFSKLGN